MICSVVQKKRNEEIYNKTCRNFKIVSFWNGNKTQTQTKKEKQIRNKKRGKLITYKYEKKMIWIGRKT